METKLYNQMGEAIGTAELPAAFFDVPLKSDLLQQVLNAQNANARKVIAHTKGRGEVRGGGKKPWKQKGTGRARHASIRSPIWKGGGVAFGPTKERNFSQKINKKMFRKALAMVLSSKVRDGEFMLLQALAFSEPKTKDAATMFKNLKVPSSVVVVTATKDRNVERAIRNIPRTCVLSATSLNVKDLLSKKYLVLTQESIPVITTTYTY